MTDSTAVSDLQRETEPRTVFVVTTGPYWEYDVLAVYDNEAAAKAFCEDPQNQGRNEMYQPRYYEFTLNQPPEWEWRK